MVRPGRDRPKAGSVDETAWVAPRRASRQTNREKSIVAVAAEEDGDSLDVPAGRVPISAAACLPSFNSIIEGSVIHTDGWLDTTVWKKGYGHKVSNIRRSSRRPHQLMPASTVSPR
jgi:hypothetical protein